MRPFTSTISLDEARRRLAAAVAPIDRLERVPLDDAAGRVAADTVRAPLDVPPFARSAMDGYAVRSADVASATADRPVRLEIKARVFTGEMPTVVIGPGECAEIATGAPLPQGADSVVMVEQSRPAGDDRVELLASARVGQHVSPRGGDMTSGDVALRPGDLLNAARVGALAAIGCRHVAVYAKPRVAIMSTGNEVIDPGQPLAPGQIYDVNRFTLAAVVAVHGGVPDPRPSVSDTVDALERALDACRDADIVVFSGGSSVGNRDLIVDALAARGEMIFHGIAVKPGKPTAFARIGTTPFFGMPGNPTSCLSNAHVLLVPFLRATARLPPFRPQTVRVPLGAAINSPAGRHQFYTVRVDAGRAWPAFKGSGDITSLSRADGYIEIPADRSSFAEGEEVGVTLF
jgi:molybdopterin molybdotransferase